MAQRRMFSPKVTSTDSFLDMPVSARELYFQLGMNADDDGFITPKRIMRMLGCSDDDLKLLIAKNFVIPFSSGVIVITARKINNLVRKDRYQQTIYKNEMAQLSENKNGEYQLVNEMLPNLVQSRSHRLGKVSIGNNNIDCDPPLSSKKSSSPANAVSAKPEVGSFEKFWAAYPNKKGKAKSIILRTKIDPSEYDAIYNAAMLYSIEVKGQEVRYIKHADTWLYNKCWEDYSTISREDLKKEMENTRTEDDEDPKRYGQGMKDKYKLLGDNREELWREDKEEIKKSKRLLPPKPSTG